MGARAIVAFLATWLAYLIVANGLLWSRAAVGLAAADHAITVRYRLAWTVWPTRLAAQDLRLEVRAGEHDVRLAFEHVRFDLDLVALASNRIVLDNLRGRGSSLRVGPTPPARAARGSPSARETTPWTIALKRGCTTLRDVAFHDLRLVGPTRICGGLGLSQNSVAIDDARVDFDAALIFIDDELVGADLRGTVAASLEPTALDEALGALTLRADLAMKTVTLEPLAQRLGSPVALGGGRGRLRLVAALEEGRLASGAYAVLELEELSARHDGVVLEGKRIVAQALGNGTWLTATVEASAAALLGERRLDLDRLAVSAEVPLDVSTRSAHLDLSAHASTLASLGSADDDAAVTRGRAWFEAHLDVEDGRVSGEMIAHGAALAARWGDTLFEGEAAARLRIRGDLAAGRLEAAGGRVAIEGSVADADSPVERWALAAQLLQASGSEREGHARAALEVGSLRPLASHPFLRAQGLGPSLAGLEGVRAAVVARWRPSGVTLTLLHARTTHASACGSWRFDDRVRTGAALVEIGREAWGITTGDEPSVTRAPDDAWRHRHLEPRRLFHTASR